MKLNFTNKNPNKLHDEFINEGLLPIKVENDLKENEYIAENVYVTFADDVDTNKINEIADKHDPTPTEHPSEQEELISNILLENATLKQQMAEQQELSSELLLQIGELKGGNENV